MKKLIIIVTILLTMILLVSCSNKVYKVTFDYNGGRDTNDRQSLSLQQTKHLNLSLIESIELIKDGYKFVSWQVDNKNVDLTKYEISSDITFKASYIEVGNKPQPHDNPNQPNLDTFKLTLGDNITVVTPNIDLLKVNKDQKVELSITIPNLKKIDKIRVNNEDIDNSSSIFEITITKDTTISVSFVDIVVSENSIINQRKKSVGSQVQFEAVVTSIVGYHIFVEDDTAGLTIYNKKKSPLSVNLEVGQKIKVDAKLSEFNGLIQIDSSTNPQISVISSNNQLPEVVDISNLSSLDMNIQSRRVNINNATISKIEGRMITIKLPSNLELLIRTQDSGDIFNLFQNKRVGSIINISNMNMSYYNAFQLMPSDVNQINIVEKELTASDILKGVSIVYLPQNSQNTVYDNIQLPTSSMGHNLSWVSKNPQLLSNSGVVVRPNKNTDVKLTVSVDVNGVVESKDFVITIIAKTETKPQSQHAQNTADISKYYQGLNTSLGSSEIFSQLSKIVNTNANVGSYGLAATILSKSDISTSNPSKLYGIYNAQLLPNRWDSGKSWNREHVWPQSKLNGASRSDAHNLRASQVKINSTRGNEKFVDGTGSAGLASGGFWPGDDHKGDVARILFYMVVKYPNLKLTSSTSSGVMGDLRLLKKWHNQDPVDQFEINRNNVIYSYQKNRNPFIDKPELFDGIWQYLMDKANLSASNSDNYNRNLYTSYLNTQVSVLFREQLF